MNEDGEILPYKNRELVYKYYSVYHTLVLVKLEIYSKSAEVDLFLEPVSETFLPIFIENEYYTCFVSAFYSVSLNPHFFFEMSESQILVQCEL